MDVKTLCLGVLFGGDASGYEIRKRLENGPFSRFQTPGYGSIYPALAALQRDGQVTMREIAQEKRPDKKVYGLTSRGRLALLEAITRPPEPDRIRSDFAFATFFGEMLPAGRIDRLLEERLADLRRHLAELERRDDELLPPGQKFTLGLAKAIYSAQVEYVETHRHSLVAAALGAESPDRADPTRRLRRQRPAAE
jgi:DNA-binding PadR family transcriptional regulator